MEKNNNIVNESFEEMMKRHEMEKVNYLERHIEKINTHLVHKISVSGNTAYIFNSGYFDLKEVKDIKFTPATEDYEARYHFHLQGSTFSVKCELEDTKNE